MKRQQDGSRFPTIHLCGLIKRSTGPEGRVDVAAQEARGFGFILPTAIARRVTLRPPSSSLKSRRNRKVRPALQLGRRARGGRRSTTNRVRVALPRAEAMRPNISDAGRAHIGPFTRRAVPSADDGVDLFRHMARQVADILRGATEVARRQLSAASAPSSAAPAVSFCSARAFPSLTLMSSSS